jgi:hypothetical protein
MSGTAEPRGVTMNTVPGLVEYYASQANVMLSQYKNINLLLGHTHDWQHPGELCEILLRDFLRRFLPTVYSVDKGFIYGRTTVDDGIHHSPEIDILVHDTQRFPPLFRMGDFAIVQPEAVRALIQVKRTLNPKQLRKGMQNVVHGKLHWVNLMRAANKNVFKQRYYVFSAVIGFDEDPRAPVGRELYHRRLRHWYGKAKRYDRREEPIALFALPDFIGSLTGSFVMNDWRDLYGTMQDRQYHMLSSSHGSGNVALQAMLGVLTQFVVGLDDRLPFSFPGDMEPLDRFNVLAPLLRSKRSRKES